MSSLDSLRGIAAIGVAFFWHYQHFQPQNGFPFSKTWYWFYHYGWNLVDFFFVLSGFVFSYVYKKQIAENQISLRKYSVLRLSRLYPLHIVTLIFVAIIQAIRAILDKGFFVYPFNDVYHLILNIFFIQSIGLESGWSFNAPSWSVSVEIISYLLFFTIIYRYHSGNKYIMFYVFFVVAGLYIYQINMNVLFFNQNIARVLIGFFVGCIAYEVHSKVSDCRFKGWATVFFACVLIAASTGAIFFGYSKFFGKWELVNSLLIYPLIILTTLNIGLINKLLSIKQLTYFGDISYSLYMWHYPVQIVIKTVDEIFGLNLDYSSEKVFVGIVILTILVSILSFEFIEKPCQRYLRKKYL